LSLAEKRQEVNRLKYLIKYILILILAIPAYATDISAYFNGTYSDIKSSKAKLEEAGFTVLAVTKVDKIGKYNSIIFTNETLKNVANIEGRGFIATMKLLVDNVNKKVRVTNPDYFARAYMQDDYKDGMLDSVTNSLKKEFGPFKGSIDKLDIDVLGKFHFMFGMPYYEDVMVLGKGKTNELVALAENNSNKEHIFTLKLSDDRFLVAIDLKKRTKKFVKKLGLHNGALLPYTILIENGKAVAMSPKYYISLSYPLLSMSEFTTIATVPGAVKKELSKLFK